jgi:hypothetical protein
MKRVSQTNELPEIDPVAEEPRAAEKRGGSKLKMLAAGASGIAILAIGAAVGLGVYGQRQVDSARRREQAAQAQLEAIKAQPPKTVTQTVTKEVPIFGRSTLMGIFASGSIQAGGVYIGTNGNQDFTPNDSTCAWEYVQLSNTYTSIVIDRSTFMTACLQSLPQTLKKDTTP